MPAPDSAWKEAEEDIRKVKRTFYHPPLPRKRQTHSAYRGRSRKVKQYTQREILQYILSQVRTNFV